MRLQQQRQHRPRHQINRVHIHPHHPLKVLLAGRRQIAHQPNPRIVHQNVQPRCPVDPVQHRGNRSRAGHIHLDRPRVRQLTRQRLRRRQIQVRNPHRRPRPRQLPRRRRANPARAPRHQRNLPIQPIRPVHIITHRNPTHRPAHTITHRNPPMLSIHHQPTALIARHTSHGTFAKPVNRPPPSAPRARHIPA